MCTILQFGSGLPRLALLAAIGIGVTEVGSAQNAPEPSRSQVCGTCHAQQFDAWRDSHHSWALRPATGGNVLGNFDNHSVEIDGATSRFFKRGDLYHVETADGFDRPREFQVKYVIGVEPLQQIMVETENGRLQPLDIAWDTEGERWFHLYPGQRISASDAFHWTGPYKNWQARCAVCHQTGFEKNYIPESGSYAATWKELTIGCEACHGDGDAHLNWANDPAAFEPSRFDGVDEVGLRMGFPQGPDRQSAEIGACGGCHSRREAFDANSPSPAAPYHDKFNLANLRPGTYHADGQIDDEVYVLGSFLQSKMYRNGVTCGHCHDPHSAQPIAEGNALCTQCHNSDGQEDFPSLPLSAFDARAHHHHDPSGEGGQCVACHMPAKTYMVVDPRRDHSFRVPRPDLSAKIGTPNACNDCHADKSTQWAADRVSEWYPNGRTGASHFGEVLKDSETLFDPGMTDRLVALASDSEAAAIVRATAISRLGERLSRDVLGALIPLLGDPDPLVRAASVRALSTAPGAVRGQYLAGLMADPARIVRQEAARATLDFPTGQLSAEQSSWINAARQDYSNAIRGRLDFPETHLHLAGMALTRRNLTAAAAAFNAALSLDPQHIDAWVTLARIAQAQEDEAGARDILQRAVDANPEAPALLQMLGSVLARLNIPGEAISVLQKAAQLEPKNLSIRADIAQIQLDRGDPAAAVVELEPIAGPDAAPEVLELLAIALARSGNISRAAETARIVKERHPLYRAGPELEALAGSGP